jgi:AbrB family looped-hinge helix DNA binding protein
MQLSSITSKGQVTIPAEIRKSLHLATGQKVKFSCKDNVITIVPVDNNISSAFGLLKSSKSISLMEMEQAITSVSVDD